jgi:DNA-directed RNA polymerase subunit N
MIVPVRCFSCGRVVAEDFEEFQKKVEKGEKPEKALDELGIQRYCCRRMLIGHIDLLDELLKYNV